MPGPRIAQGPLPLLALGLLLLSMLGVGVAQAAEAARSTDDWSPDEIVACARKNVPEGDELRAITLVARDRAGFERVTRANVFARRTQEGRRHVALSFTAPPELEGSSLLILEQESGTETWIHTPLLGRKRLGDSQGGNLFGTGVSYEEFVHLLGVVRVEAGRVTRLDDIKVGERPVYVLDSRPRQERSAYGHVVTFIDQEMCIPLRVRLYDRDQPLPRKVISTDPEQIFPVGSIWIAHSVSMIDRRDGKQMVVHVESISPDIAIPDRIFAPDSLGRGKPRIEIVVQFDPVEIDLPRLGEGEPE